MDNLKSFLTLTAQAVAIRDAEADWKTKYDLIFSPEISGRIGQTDISFEWYDPDTDYDEDVMAYVSALQKKAEELKLILESLNKIPDA